MSTIISAQSGFFDVGSTWVGGSVPGTSDDWVVDGLTRPGTTAIANHVVTLRTNRTQSGMTTIYGNLVIGDSPGPSNITLAANANVFNHNGGSIEVRGSNSLTLGAGNSLYNTGDVSVNGLVQGGAGSQFLLMNLDYALIDLPARTIAIHNPFNILLPGVALGVSLTGGSGSYDVPDGGVVLRLTYDYAPLLPLGGEAITGVDAIDLNFVAPGSTVEDFGFPWDWNNGAWLPQVWAILDGQIVTATISIQWISDTQWRWFFTLPGGATPGQKLMVTTSRDDGCGHWRLQQLRAEVRKPWVDNEFSNVSIIAPTGPAGNVREMLVQLWRRFFKKAIETDSQLKTFADDGTTVVTTQAMSDDGTTQTQGAAT